MDWLYKSDFVKKKKKSINKWAQFSVHFIIEVDISLNIHHIVNVIELNLK